MVAAVSCVDGLEAYIVLHRPTTSAVLIQMIPLIQQGANNWHLSNFTTNYLREQNV